MFAAELEGLREVVDVTFGFLEPARCAQLLERRHMRDRREERDRASPICHLQRLAGFDTAQVLARSLSELTDPDRRHVLLIARWWSNQGPSPVPEMR